MWNYDKKKEWKDFSLHEKKKFCKRETCGLNKAMSQENME